MKKVLVVCFLLTTAQTFAQKFGITGGLALAKYDAVGKTSMPGYSKSDITTSNKNGIILGGFVELELIQNLFFRPGLQLVTKGAIENNTFTNNGTPYRFTEFINFSALDLPLNIIYKIKAGKGNLLLGGGVVPGILSDSRFDGLDFGANVLTGYELAKGISANVTYTHGLKNVATNAPYYESLKNHYLGVVLGYTFPRQQSTRTGTPASTAEPLQEPSKPATALFAELGGPGGIPSVNFDTRLTKSRNGLGLRFGVGLLNDQDGEGVAIPLALNYLVGERSNFFEIAAGAGYYKFHERSQSSFFDFPKDKSVIPFVWFGYRYQSAAKRFLFRAGFNKFLVSGTGEIMNFPFPSLSFGYSFR